MIFVFYFFAAVLIVFSLKSFLGGIRYLNFFKSQIAKPRSEYMPFVTVIAPCRGIDHGMAENLRSLYEQDYPAYEIVFVVDDPDDAAVRVIESLSAQFDSNEIKSQLVIAGKAIGCGQKVENLRAAVIHAATKSEAFVFVDSDVRPSGEWLRNLIAPLEDKSVGAATGYRWFISPRPTFASELRSVWNASVASALGPDTGSNFCWGGSTAIRRDVFERLDIRENWKGTVSDDFAATRTLNQAHLPIVFVPQALAATIENCTLAELLEFTTRQMKITRVYATKLWLMSLFGSGLFNAVMAAAVLIAIFSERNDVAVWAAVFTIILVSALSIGKSWLRLTAVKLVMTGHNAELRRQFWTQNTLWMLAPAVFFYNSLAALVSRRMIWRGTVYELKSPTETVIIAP